MIMRMPSPCFGLVNTGLTNRVSRSIESASKKMDVAIVH